MFVQKKKYKESKIKYEKKISRERLPNILESECEGNSFKFIGNKKEVYEIKNYDIDTNCSNYNNFSLYDSNNLNIYDGNTNIWVNKKDLFKYPKYYDINKIDIFSCLHGYCLVSRSKVFNNVSLKCFRDLSSNIITNNNCHTFCKNDVVLAKMLHWKKYIPCSILKVNDKISYGSEKDVFDLSNFGESTFNVTFPSCPDSEIYLAWHNHNSIIQNKSVLSYPKKNLLEEIEEVDVIFEDDSSDEDNCENNDIVNILNDILNNIINKVVSGVNYRSDLSRDIGFGNNSYGDSYDNNVSSSFTNNELIVTGVIDKNVIDKEILKFNTYWIKNSSYNSIEKIIARKSITVAANEFSKNISKNFLQNVCVLENYEMDHILKLQEINGYGCKFFDWNLNYENALYNNKLEPQEYKFFKFSSNYGVIKDYLSRKKGVTFTGALCETAKKYLFNITNSRF